MSLQPRIAWRWTADRVGRFVTAYEQGVSVEDLAQRFVLSHSSTKVYISKFGARRHRPRRKIRMITYDSIADVPAAEWRWPNFTPEDMACRHTGRLLLDEDFMDRLQEMRTALGFPFRVNSGYRHPSHPIEAGKQRPGAHSLGKAVNLRVAHGGERYELLTRAREFGFTGIGFEAEFVHLDTATTVDLGGTVRPAAWKY